MAIKQESLCILIKQVQLCVSNYFNIAIGKAGQITCYVFEHIAIVQYHLVICTACKFM